MIVAADSALLNVPRARDIRPAVHVEMLSKRFRVRRRIVDAVRAPRDRRYTTALDRVTFSAAQGEIVGFLGANGAGKTTLLKMLSTLVVPDSGSATVMGFDLVAQPAQVRGVLAPVAADERSLDWRLPARENLRFFGALLGLRGRQLQDRIDEVLAGVGLEDAGSKLVGAFSSGMRQRLLIARALLSRARVLLLDEPTRSLDPLAARAFRSFLRREVVDREGCTVLLATHDPDEALELCDRVAVLHHGQLLAAGTPLELTRAFTTERYRLWTRTPDNREMWRILGRCAAEPVRSWDEHEGLTLVEFDLPANFLDSGQVIATLVAGGAHVARFEKVQLKLPDLMERVMSRVDHA